MPIRNVFICYTYHVPFIASCKLAWPGLDTPSVLIYTNPEYEFFNGGTGTFDRYKTMFIQNYIG